MYAPILPQNHNSIATYSVALSNLYHLMKEDLLHKKLESPKQRAYNSLVKGIYSLVYEVIYYLYYRYHPYEYHEHRHH